VPWQPNQPKTSTKGDTTMRTSLSTPTPATLALALILTLSCSSTNSNSDETTPSSSSAIRSSSSVLQSSSSKETSSSSKTVSSSSIQPGVVYGPSVNYKGEIYETVVIGNQTWFKRNLNYNASGSACNDNIEANCDKYGRLYEWTTANNICPSGWHLPNDDDWFALINYIEENKNCYDCVAKHLKATSGWNSNGEDSYGFSALPGDMDYSSGVSSCGGPHNDDCSVWWSASEHGGSSANCWYMSYNNDNSGPYQCYDIKEALYSVRCLKDYSSSSSKPSSSSVNVNVVYGDPVNYEGETYKTVVIGNQTWFQRNLNYAAEGSKCNSEIQANCAKYGRLYDWATAMALPASCNSTSCYSEIADKHKGVCPSGWHIPSDDDFKALVEFLDPNCPDYSLCGNDNKAATKLKTTTGWALVTLDPPPPVGTDDYGFSALPGGLFDILNNFFIGDNHYGQWWSASVDETLEYKYNTVRGMGIATGSESLALGNTYKENLYSVRCLKD